MAENVILDRTKEELAEVDKVLAELKQAESLGKDMDFLMKNQEFQNVFLLQYTEAEAERLLGTLIDPTNNFKRDVMENLMDKVIAIRHFKQFCSVTKINGTMAKERIDEEEAYRLEITKRENIVENEEV